MSSEHLNLYDFISFPPFEIRERIRAVFDIEDLRLLDNGGSWWDSLPKEIYQVWKININNYLSRLNIHFFNMCHIYFQNPPEYSEITDTEKNRMLKMLFDMYAELTCLHIVSYFEKILSMLKDIFCIKRKIRKRIEIIKRLQAVGDPEFENVVKMLTDIVDSDTFSFINAIRDDFIHNKSQFYVGMNIEESDGWYGSFNSEGLSTETVYTSIIKLLGNCVHLNSFLCEFVRNSSLLGADK